MEYRKEIEISTGIEPNFLQNILTKDISTLEALYDLVDNSIIESALPSSSSVNFALAVAARP